MALRTPSVLKTPSVWADGLCQGVLLTLLVWREKKGKELKKKKAVLSSACVVFVLLRLLVQWERLS